MSTTESPSNYDNLESMPLSDLLLYMNDEDHRVAPAVKKVLPKIEGLVKAVAPRMKEGGRLFYIGAGTSGRLGIVDASECPPTFGVDYGLVIGLIAGGDTAVRKAVEFAEDNPDQAWEDMQIHQVNDNDTVIGIAASGRTPYVIGGVKKARANGLLTGCITCNSGSELAASAEHPIEVIVGPEFVTGSTRLKAGTAQKMVLNLLSTSIMIQLGKVRGNRMVDMQLSNDKLVDRGVKMVAAELHLPYEKAKDLLIQYGSVRKTIDQESS